ncbi:NAD(P)/FAD-dependent oxidoreductase [Acetobacteraceae bacterium]|nr:NAD(P)/FAD-dependent oxidoreductase [Acetobacteraceae bacterium]
MPNADKTTKKIVVLGGGIGGMNVLRKLKDLKNISATLIDPHLFHICKPALHEVAAGSLAPKDNGFPFTELARKFNFNFIQAKSQSIDTNTRTIQLSTGDVIDYDWLVIACGAVPNVFHIEGVEEHAYFLNNTADADDIYKKVQIGVRAASQQKRSFKVAVIGGGPTGVQLTAELYKTFAKRHSPSIDVSIVEGAPKLLPSFAENIGLNAAKRLAQLPVNVCLNAQVSKATPEGIFLKDETFIPADMVIWTAGVKANTSLKVLLPDFEFARNGALVVRNTLQTTKDPRILAVGDCAFIADKPLPPTAQVARKEGIYVQQTALPALLEGKTPESFVYQDQGSIVVLAQYAGWAELPSGKTYGGKGLGNCFAHFLHNCLFIRQQYELGGLSFVVKKFLKKKLS